MPSKNKDIIASGNKMRELRYNHFICNWKTDLHQKNKLPKLDIDIFIKSEPRILYSRNKRYQRRSFNKIEGHFPWT